MSTNHYALYVPGYSCAIMVDIIHSIYKINRSSDYKLKLVYMKQESIVIAGQLYCGEPSLSSVHTARHTLEIGFISQYFFNICKNERGT